MKDERTLTQQRIARMKEMVDRAKTEAEKLRKEREERERAEREALGRLK